MGMVGGALNLFFIYKFIRILTTPFESTDAFKLGIVDETGKILRKHGTLKTTEEKESYTMMHRLVWKLKRLMEKIPFGKSRLASYAAALWLIKEETNFKGSDKELQESFLSFLETDWETEALILKENYEGDMDKKTFKTLKEGLKDITLPEGADKDTKGDKEAYQKFFKATLKKFGVDEPDQLQGDKKKEFFDAIDKGWKADNEKPEPGDKKESFEIGTQAYLDHCKDVTPGEREVVKEKKSSTGYELYHKTFSDAMQHAYDFAKKKGAVVDKKEIDDKVATGPKKPSSGKTNRYSLKAGRKTVEIQVANLDNKSYELNMYIEGFEIVEADKEALKRALAVSKWKKAGGKVDKQPENIEKWWGQLSPADRKRAETIAQYKKEKKQQKEEVQVDEGFIDAIVDKFKSILIMPKNVALMIKSILNGNVKDMEAFSSNLSDGQRDKMIKVFADQLRARKYKGQKEIHIIKLLATLKLDSLKQKEEVEVSEGIRDFKMGDKVKFVNDDSRHLGEIGKITSLSGNGISQKATVKLNKGGKSVTNVFVKLDLIKEEVELGEAKGTAYPATIDTLKMIVKNKQNQTVMFKSGQAIVDLFTASAMVQVYDALKPKTKKKFEDMIKDKAGFMKSQAFAMKMMEQAKWRDNIREMNESFEHVAKTVKSFKTMVNPPVENPLPGIEEEKIEEKIEERATLNDFSEYISEGRPKQDPNYVPPATDKDKNRTGLRALVDAQKKHYSSQDIQSIARKYKIKLPEEPVGGKTWDWDWEIVAGKGISLSYRYGLNSTFIKGWKFDKKRAGIHLAKYGNEHETIRDMKGSGGKVQVTGLESAFELIGENFQLGEDAPANSVAGGNVNLDPFKKKRKNAKIETESFGGSKVFVVSPQRFYDSRLGKSRYSRYEKYVGNDKLGEAIRTYGRTNPKESIILKNSGNGAMLYLKYGKGKG